MTAQYKVFLFDFGNVFLNLDLNATKDELLKLGLTEFNSSMILQNQLYEQGLVTTAEFIDFYKIYFPNASSETLKNAWNKILLDFPLERLEFLEEFSKKHTCMLLSNINDMHLTYIKTNLGNEFYNRFINCFDKIYYSHLIHMRKPNKEIYEHVLLENDLKANQVFFIDDTKENIDAAKKLGYKTWHIIPLADDVINLVQNINKQ